MRSRGLAIGVLLLVLLNSAGCWDATSPEQMAWVVALGVDEGKVGNLLFTFQIMVPKAVSAAGTGGSGRGDQGHNMVVFSVEAPDVITAVELSDAFVARRVTLQHAKVVVLGEEVVRQGIAKFLAPAIRFRDFRRTLFMMVARGTAQEFLQHAKPRIEADPALWYEMMMSWQQQTNLVPPVRIHQMVVAHERPGRGARAALVAARPELREGEAEVRGAHKSVEGEIASPSRFYAGQLPRSGEIPVEFIGTACFKSDRLVGYLTGQETRVVSLLRGELQRRTPVAVPDPANPGEPVILILRTQRPPAVKVRRNGNQVTAEINILMEGDIGSVPTITDYSTPEGMRRLEAATERFIKGNVEKVLKKSLNEWGIDLFELGDRIQSGFPTIQAWEAFDWARRVQDTRFVVSVTFRIRRHGLQKHPASPAR